MEKTRRERYLEAGLCTRCGKNQPMENRLLCQACKDYRVSRSVITKKYLEKYNARKRKESAEKGFCTWCYKRKAVEGKTYCQRCYDNSLDRSTRARKKRILDGRCHSCLRPARPGKATCEYHASKARQEYYDIRNKILDNYGRKCACCGETIVEFLALDHVNGGGRQHLKDIGIPKGGKRFYQWIIKENFPDGFQILCHNCNFAKGHWGECPHKKLNNKEDLS